MELVKDTVDKLAKEINAQSVVYRDDIATLSVIGEGISTSPQVPGKIFEILAENNINIDVISSSPLTISCIIDKDQIKTAVSALHQELIENEVEF
jgi:aspartate kinase